MNKGQVNIPSVDAASLRTSILYALVGFLWILFSDELLSLTVTDAVALTRLQTLKGWIFIIVTATFLFFLVRRDLGMMRRSELALQESEKMWRLLTERIRDYEIFMLDTDGHIILWNVGAAQSKGYTPEEIIGAHHSVFFTEEDIRTGIPEHELEVAASEGSYEDEGWRVRKDGSMFWANVITTALRDDDGTLRGYSKVVRDITERKKAGDALRESEARYRIIAETASDMIITIDDQSVIQFVNPASEKIFGYPPQELIGQSVTLLMPEHMRSSHLDALRAYITTGKRKMRWEAIELPGLHRSGREVPLEISYGEFMKDGRHYFSGIIRDISERKEAERNKQYRDMLERFNQEIETLVSERTMNLLAMTLADRVRNPSTVIGATADRILKKEEMSEKGKEKIRFIIDEAVKLDRTVKDFQSLLKGSETLFHYEEVCSVVQDIVPVFDREVARKHISLRTALPEQPLKVNMAKDLLGMALYMLLKNAIEMTPEGGLITVSVSGDAAMVSLTVADNGQGIPKDVLDKLFDPFSDIGAYRFGMGWPLIKQIVSEHLGEITVSSVEGKGTTVTMIFPSRWTGVDAK